MEIWLTWRLPRRVQRVERNSGEHRRWKHHGKVWVFRQVPLTANVRASGRVERRGLARLGKVCPGCCQPPCPSLPLHVPGAPPSTSQQAGWGVCQLQGSENGRPPSQAEIEGESKRVLEPLRPGQNRLERLGWGSKAGPSRLEEPVYLLPGVGLCSEGRSQQAGVYQTQ